MFSGFASRFGRGQLLAGLQSSNSKARTAAAVELGRREDERAVPALLTALATEPTGSVRLAIIDALGVIGDRRAVPSLINLLEQSGRQQIAAARALGRIGDPRALDPIAHLMAQPVTRNVAIEALLGLGPRVLIRGTALLRQPETTVAACRLLGLLGDRRALWPMVEALSSPVARVRGECAEALGKLGDSRAGRALVGLMSDPQEPVRRRALRGLAQVADGGVTADLAALTVHEELVIPLAPLLRGPEAAQAVPALVKMVAAVQGRGRREGILALGRIGGPDAIAALEGMLASDDPNVRYHAAGSLARSTRDQGLPPLLRTARGDGPAKVDAMRALGDLFRPIPVLEEHGAAPREVRALARSLLLHETMEVAGAAAFVSGSIQDRGALPMLGQLLSRPEPYLRAQAIAAVGWIGSLRACPLVAHALEDPDEGVRAAAAWAAAEAECSGHGREIGARLLRLLEGNQDLPAINAAWALGALGIEEAVPALRERLTDGPEAQRANAALALAELGDTRSARALRLQVRREESVFVKAALARALGRLGGRSSEHLLTELASQTPPLGATAQQSLRAVTSDARLARPQGSAAFRARLINDAGAGQPGLVCSLVLSDQRVMAAVSDTAGEVTALGLPAGPCQLTVGVAQVESSQGPDPAALPEP